MHLANLGEDDFYRRGSKATEGYFNQNALMSEVSSQLKKESEPHINNMDLREREKVKKDQEERDKKEKEAKDKEEDETASKNQEEQASIKA